MRVLDLFSGIGGFSLGLERAGMKTAMFCEIEPFCRAALAKHWPGVPIHDDVSTLDSVVVAQQAGAIDLVCGGFPCQDISIAGRGAGLGGDRSGLWFEYLRIIGEVRPRWVIIENVPALRSRGLDVVLGGLAALGYDAEWHCIPASAVGAPHRRDRVWIVAHSNGGLRDGAGNPLCAGRGAADAGGQDVADADSLRCQPNACGQFRDDQHHPQPRREALADAGRAGLPRPEQAGWGQPIVSAADVRRAASECSWGRSQSGMGGEIDGVPARVDRTRPVEAWEGNTPRAVGRGAPNRRPRLKALGNSVVPQVVELIGRAIMQREAATCSR